MAILSFGDVITGARGTVGGVTYSRNGAGAYAKAWSRGPVVKNALTQGQRLLVNSMGANWRALTDAQREAWRVLADGPIEVFYNAFGQEIRLSGWQLFCALVLRQLTVGETPDYAPRVAYVPLVVDSLSVSAQSGVGASVMWGGSPGDFAGQWLVVFANVFQGGVARAPKSGARYVGSVQMAPGNSYPVGAWIEAVFGPLAARQVLTVWVYKQIGDPTRKGWRSPVMEATTVVTG